MQIPHNCPYFNTFTTRDTTWWQLCPVAIVTVNLNRNAKVTVDPVVNKYISVVDPYLDMVFYCSSWTQSSFPVHCSYDRCILVQDYYQYVAIIFF